MSRRPVSSLMIAVVLLGVAVLATASNDFRVTSPKAQLAVGQAVGVAVEGAIAPATDAPGEAAVETVAAAAIAQASDEAVETAAEGSIAPAIDEPSEEAVEAAAEAAAEAQNAVATGLGLSLAEPFTISSRFRFIDLRSEAPNWRVGLASAEESAPDALALVWGQDATGWFPVWKLRLETRLDLFPAGLVDQRDGERAFIDFADLRPESGKEYRAGISYDPADATLSVVVEDAAGSVLYAANLPLRQGDGTRHPGAGDPGIHYPGPLFPGAGWDAGDASPAGPDDAVTPPVEPLEFAVSKTHERHGLPLPLMRGFRSTLLEVSPETGALSRKLGQEYLKGQAAGLRLEWPAEPVAGEAHVILAAGGEETLLAIAAWQAESQDIAFEPDALPPGESHLVLEFVQGTHRSELARHPARVIEARVRANFTIHGRDYDRDLVVGTLTVAPDLGIAHDAELVVEASYEVQGDGGALEDGAVKPFVVLRHGFEALDEAVSFPLAIPAPPRSGALRLEASIQPGQVVVAGGSRRFPVKGIDDGAVDGAVVAAQSGPNADAGDGPAATVGTGSSSKAEPAAPALFPFVVNPWQESPDNVTNVSHWLERPAGKGGFISIEGERFVRGDGTPIRFLGVNCAFAGCFPDHATAERLARQLARFGVNLVRFHHMDMQEAPGGIWRRGAFPRRLDPGQLDRLDYFIYQLKENGIYSNLNLHVSRTMSPQEGFPEPEKRPDFDKGLSLFDPRILEHQKEYARELLTHQNPYTGNRYVDEPAVAMIEVTNENGLILFTQWGGVDAMPERYQEALDARWQQWLAERYGTTQSLAEAWGGGDLAAASEIAANGRLDRGLAYWTLETDDDRHATMQVVPLGGPVLSAPSAESHGRAEAESQGDAGAEVRAETDSASPALQVNVIAKGSASWRPQVYHTGLSLKPGKPYLISFWLKANRPHTITANLMMHHDPWNGFASFQTAVTTEWQRFEFVARVPESAAVREGRVSFTNLEAGAVYWIAGVSVQELQGDGLGLPAGEGLESGVSRPAWHSLGMRSSRVQQDYIEFLWDVEQAYFAEMRRFIKEELGARAPISGTQVPWSPPGIQAQLDYVDAHAYWNHPEFPGASWDSFDWLVRNNSMTASADGGAIASLARTRVAGKPYIVSEYNHPAPITFGSEAFLLAGAYGAFQDWDGLIAFAWSHDADFWPQRIPNFFDIKSHPTKLVTLPAVAALLLRGDVRPGEEMVYAALPDGAQRRRLLETTAFGVGTDAGGVPALTALQHRLALVVDEDQAPGERSLQDQVEHSREEAPTGNEGVHLPPQGPVVTSDTGELRWERTGAGRAVVTIDAERSKAVIGYGAGRAFDLSGVTLAPGPTRQQGWSAITLTVMEGENFAGPGRILMTATGYAENTGIVWERLGGDAVTVRNRWGEAPSLVEGIPARIELPMPPEGLSAYALDGAGNRREAVPVRASEHDPGRAVIDIGPEYRTLWYEIEVAGP